MPTLHQRRMVASPRFPCESLVAYAPGEAPIAFDGAAYADPVVVSPGMVGGRTFYAVIERSDLDHAYQQEASEP